MESAERLNSQTGKVLKRADAHTILPYTDVTPKSKVTVALENIKIQEALMNFESQGSRNSKTERTDTPLICKEKAETVLTFNS